LRLSWVPWKTRLIGNTFISRVQNYHQDKEQQTGQTTSQMKAMAYNDEVTSLSRSNVAGIDCSSQVMNVRKMIFSIKVICHPLRLLKIPQVSILGDLCCLKGSCFFFQILVQSHCPRKLPAKLRDLAYPPSLLANWERLWNFDLDKSQVRHRYNCIRAIRRTHWQSFCAHVSAQL
jgi:hypothetical protein